MNFEELFLLLPWYLICFSWTCWIGLKTHLSNGLYMCCVVQACLCLFCGLQRRCQDSFRSFLHYCWFDWTKGPVEPRSVRLCSVNPATPDIGQNKEWNSVHLVEVVCLWSLSDSIAVSVKCECDWPWAGLLLALVFFRAKKGLGAGIILIRMCCWTGRSEHTDDEAHWDFHSCLCFAAKLCNKFPK